MDGTWQDVANTLSKVTEKKIQFIHKEAVFGGDINQAWKVTDSTDRHWFIKTNQPSLVSMFAAEAKGLEEIVQSNTIRAPKSFCYGVNDDVSYLILEYIQLSSGSNQSQLGEQLAEMHHCLRSNVFTQDQSTLFGWPINNTIGSTLQSNISHKTWTEFYKKERLISQLNLAKSNGYSNTSFERGLLLATNMHYFFGRYNPKASLLHGDLWGGNCAADDQGNPVIFDPAVYFGDRETDIAMTELFGGFSTDFYSSYQYHFPLDQDYKTRKNLYNLYHILNHYNLFGGSYANQASDMTEKLLSEIGI